MIRKDADLNATIANIKGCLNKLVQMVRELHMKQIGRASCRERV